MTWVRDWLEEKIQQEKKLMGGGKRKEIQITHEQRRQAMADANDDGQPLPIEIKERKQGCFLDLRRNEIENAPKIREAGKKAAGKFLSKRVTSATLGVLHTPVFIGVMVGLGLYPMIPRARARS